MWKVITLLLDHVSVESNLINYDDRTSWLHGSPKYSVQDYDDGDVFVDDDVDYGEGDGDGDGYYLQAWTRLSSRGRQRDSTAQPTPPQCFSSESNWGVPKIVSIWSGSKVMIMAMMTWPGKQMAHWDLFCARVMLSTHAVLQQARWNHLSCPCYSVCKMCAQPTTAARPNHAVRFGRTFLGKKGQAKLGKEMFAGQGQMMTDNENHSSI